MLDRRSRTTFRRRLGLVLAAAALGGPVLGTPAHAEGPGYGGTANALTLRWLSITRHSGLALYAFGFRAGTTVRIRVGSADECRVAADRNGQVRLALARNGSRATGTTGMKLVAEVTSTAPEVVQPGASVMVVGQTPAGSERTLIGAVPPAANGVGAAQLVPVAVASMLVAGAVVWARRRLAGAMVAGPSRHRHRPRHRHPHRR